MAADHQLLLIEGSFAINIQHFEHLVVCEVILVSYASDRLHCVCLEGVNETLLCLCSVDPVLSKEVDHVLVGALKPIMVELPDVSENPIRFCGVDDHRQLFKDLLDSDRISEGHLIELQLSKNHVLKGRIFAFNLVLDVFVDFVRLVSLKQLLTLQIEFLDFPLRLLVDGVLVLVLSKLAQVFQVFQANSLVLLPINYIENLVELLAGKVHFKLFVHSCEIAESQTALLLAVTVGKQIVEGSKFALHLLVELVDPVSQKHALVVGLLGHFLSSVDDGGLEVLV